MVKFDKIVRPKNIEITAKCALTLAIMTIFALADADDSQKDTAIFDNFDIDDVLTKHVGEKDLSGVSLEYHEAILLSTPERVLKSEDLPDFSYIIPEDKESYDKAVICYKNYSFGECVSLISWRLNQEQRSAAFAILVEIAYEYGIPISSIDLINLLNLYKEAFQLPDGHENAILWVLRIKNDWSIFE